MSILYAGEDEESASALYQACSSRGLEFRRVEVGRVELRGSDIAMFADWPLNSPVAPVLAVLQAGRSRVPSLPVVCLVPKSLPALLRRAQGEGAFDVLGTPLSAPEVEAEIDALLQKAPLLDKERREQFENICARTLLGRSESFQRALVELQRASVSEATVLLLGETGTGKEVFARAIHDLGRRRSVPYVPVNCAGIPESLLEAELFGHAKGAFTGADRARGGILEAAAGGTLLLDEIGDMPLYLQAKILRVLESREYMPLGDPSPHRFSARVIAATSVDLSIAVATGKFRRDLLGRINQFQIRVPPLRERLDDVELLLRFFIEKHGRARPIELSETARGLLLAYDYPMNVRELENAVITAVSRCAPGLTILPRHLPAEIVGDGRARPREVVDLSIPLSLSYGNARQAAAAAVDRHYLGKMLADANGNQSVAAVTAGIDRKTFAARWKAAYEDQEP
jgi:DNA-binding NtrC family response regulator